MFDAIKSKNLEPVESVHRNRTLKVRESHFQLCRKSEHRFDNDYIPAKQIILSKRLKSMLNDSARKQLSLFDADQQNNEIISIYVSTV